MLFGWHTGDSCNYGLRQKAKQSAIFLPCRYDSLPMAETKAWKLLLPRQLRHLPADLAGVVCVVILTNLAALLPVVSETPVRIIAGLVFVLFIPGYAFIAALFPEAGSGPSLTVKPVRTRNRSESRVERLHSRSGRASLSVRWCGLVLNFRRGAPTASDSRLASGLTLVLTAVAAVRAGRCPPTERFRVPYRAWLTPTCGAILAGLADGRRPERAARPERRARSRQRRLRGGGAERRRAFTDSTS